MKTGYRPDPTVEHPSIGAICCHELPVDRTDIPRHISILPGQWPSRGGFLGGEFDAFQVDDPTGPPARRDVAGRPGLASWRGSGTSTSSSVPSPAAVAAASRRRCTARRIARARVMMSSEQLKAFDVSREPAARPRRVRRHPVRPRLPGRPPADRGRRPLRRGDARRLGHPRQQPRDPPQSRRGARPGLRRPAARPARRGLLDRTVVLCGGEFGRTPQVNLAGGRDHWPKGFSLALAGGGLRGGLAIGETDPEGKKDPARPTTVEDVHATVLTALGLDPAKANIAPATSRPIKLSADRTERHGACLRAGPRPPGPLAGSRSRVGRVRRGCAGCSTRSPSG